MPNRSALDQPTAIAAAEDAPRAEKPLKIESIQALRGLAVLLVLLRHLLVMEGKYGHQEMLLSDFWKVGDSGVDLFFVISGFVMVTVSKNLFQKAGAVAGFLWKRGARIYPLYWLYTLVVLAVYLKNPQMVGSSQGNRVDLLASFTLWPQYIMPLLGQGWTLTYELYFYLVFALTLMAPARLLPLWLILWAALVTLGWTLMRAKVGFLQNAPSSVVFNTMTIEFILGCGVALLTRRGWRTGGLAAIGCGVLALFGGTYFGDAMMIGGMRLFAFGLPAVLIVYGAVVLEMRRGWRFPRWLEKIGDASYSIYLSHILVISLIGRVWMAVGRRGLWDNALALLLMALASVFVGFASYRLVEQPLLRFFHTRQFKRTGPAAGGAQAEGPA